MLEIAKEMGIVGFVLSGRGVAKQHVRDEFLEIKRATGEAPIEGTLNCILSKPIRFSHESALFIGEEGRMLWPASLSGTPVWIYRWRHAPLHVVELIASVYLREKLRLSDGDRIELLVQEKDIAPIRSADRLAWRICWLGRRNWSYKNDQYYFLTREWCIAHGATQCVSDKSIGDIMKNLMKNAVKKIPVIGNMAVSIKEKISPSPVLTAANKPLDYVFQREEISNNVDEKSRGLAQLKNILNYTKTSGTSYSADQFPAGYHTIDIFGALLEGQRSPGQRLEAVPIDFSGKSVLDIGCNQGGMLFHNADRLKWGVGLDYDSHMVNAGNRIKALIEKDNLDFYVFNLELDPLDLIKDLLPEPHVDIVFLLSVCMWIDNWREVIQFSSSISSSMLFETNGSDQQQQDQVSFLREVYSEVDQLKSSSDDDPGQSRRKLYYCTSSRLHS